MASTPAGKSPASNPGPADRNSKTTTIQKKMLESTTVDVYEKYKEWEVLGRGSMGHVARVTLRDEVIISRRSLQNRFSTNSTRDSTSSTSSSRNYNALMRNAPDEEEERQSFALKSILLDRISNSFITELKNEIDILNTMDHPNIVKLHEVISNRKQIYLILELCDGGDLYTRLPYTEQDSAYITGKLLSAIKYMHDHAIVHRDLKFENIMFENKKPGAEIKVIDFGLSKKFVSSKLGLMKEGVGTLCSMAPQVLQQVYTSQADMWSVGVIAYMLLSSHRPFYSKKRDVMINKIMRCDYTFEKDYWKPISDEGKDFIDHLLVVDPKVRYRAEQAQAHKWMHKEFKLEDRAPTEKLTMKVTNVLSAYQNNLPLKKLALNVIAHKSSTDEIINLRKAFDQFDTANNGVISADEFKAALQDKCSYTVDEIQKMFDAIDINQNGHIMYTEFIAASLEAQGQLNEDRVAEAFDRLDTDGSGVITKENMLEFLSDTGASMEDVERMIKEADIDDSGGVSYDEFLTLFRSDNQATSETLANGLNAHNFTEIVVTETVEETERTTIANEEELLGVDAKIPGGKYDEE